MASSEMAALTLKVKESSTKERRVGLAALGKLRLSARSPSVVLTVRAMAVVVTETGMALAGWGRTAGRRRNQFIGRESGAQGEMAVVKSCPEVRQR